MKLILQAIKSLLNKLHIRLGELENKTSDENIANGKLLPDSTPFAISKPYFFSELLTFSFGSTFASSSELNLTVGNTYTVRYNGEDYECECKLTFYQGDWGYYLGDGSRVNADESSGEPFAVFVWDEPTSEYKYLVLTDSGVDAVELSITGEIVYIRKMAEQLLPGACCPLIIDASVDGDAVIIESGHVHRDVRRAIGKEGRDVVIRCKLGANSLGIFRLAHVDGYIYSFNSTDLHRSRVYAIIWDSTSITYRYYYIKVEQQ